MSIYSKLSKIQVELKAPKSQYNSFGKYNYRNCEDILEAVKPLCNKYGTALIIADNIELIGDRYYIKAIATLYDVDSGESVSGEAYAREPADKKGMDASQVTGASSSYARKYALNGLFNIDDTKDADYYDNSQSSTKSTRKQPKPLEPQKDLETLQTEVSKLYQKYKSNPFFKMNFDDVRGSAKSLKEMNAEQCQLVIDFVRMNINTLGE